jgi:hypothetical protein
MTRAWAIRVAVALAVIGVTVSAANADEGTGAVSARLSGFSEVVPNGPILTTGSGSFHATIHGNSLTYTLKFSNLSSAATASHIHFAQSGVGGGIVVWLCGPTGAAPAGTPTCPANGGTVTGTITAAAVQAVPLQGVPAGDFTGLVRIIRAGDAYVNVHSVNFPKGEIRGQVSD